MYSEKRYNEWKSTGTHTMSKITTKSGSNCCSAGGTYTVDMNKGEGGDYYFVYDGSDIANPENLPKTGSLIVVQLSTI
jgi:hypothetical protein